jgi:transcriptional regulator with XRE-family HTH domain
MSTQKGREPMKVRIGERIKKVRLQKGYTLKDVAGESGYSKALISRIENENVSPSINSLLKIAAALQIKPHDLFFPPKDTIPPIIQKAEREQAKMDEGRIVVEFLTNHAEESKLESLIITMDPGASTGSELGGQTGEIWMTQLKGQIELTLGMDNIVLESGDSIYFKASIPHSFKNTGKGKSALLCAITPPRS